MISSDELLIENVVTGCTSFINKALLDVAKPIPSDSILHDKWLALVASRFGSIIFIPAPLVSYRQHESNVIGASRSGILYIIFRLFKFFNYPPWRRIEHYYIQAKLFYKHCGGRVPLIMKYQRANICKRFLILFRGRLKKNSLSKQIPFILTMLLRLPFYPRQH